MPTTEVCFRLQPFLGRKEIRKDLIQKFLEETAGTGTGEYCSKYIYCVDKLQDGKRVLLKRPAPLNKGVDFEVHIEGIEFRNKGPKRTMPSHDNIIDDLTEKKEESEKEYEKVKTLISKLFDCETVSDNELRSLLLLFTQGHPVEGILKAIKWLFIEQDVTYWNWSGRYMLWNALKEKSLC